MQSVHAAPPVPQAMAWLPTAQTLLSQQPMQDAGEHGIWHAPPAIPLISLHACPMGQAVHAPP